jgi:hypothetical protein
MHPIRPGLLLPLDVELPVALLAQRHVEEVKAWTDRPCARPTRSRFRLNGIGMSWGSGGVREIVVVPSCGYWATGGRNRSRRLRPLPPLPSVRHITRPARGPACRRWTRPSRASGTAVQSPRPGGRALIQGELPVVVDLHRLRDVVGSRFATPPRSSTDTARARRAAGRSAPRSTASSRSRGSHSRLACNASRPPSVAGPRRTAIRSGFSSAGASQWAFGKS